MLKLKKEGKRRILDFGPNIKIGRKDRRLLEWGIITYFTASPNIRILGPSENWLCNIKVRYYLSYIYSFVYSTPIDSNGAVCEDFSDYI